MKNKLVILLVIILASCSSIKYINKPVHKNPCVKLKKYTKRILVAMDKCISDVQYESDLCLDGFKFYLNQTSNIDIVDRVYFIKKVDSIVLQELMLKFNIDGLLLLRKMYIHETSKSELIDRISRACIDCKKYYYIENETFLTINSVWLYFDFHSCATYKYFEDNYGEFKFRYQMNKISTFEKNRSCFINDLLFETGKKSLIDFYGL